uniref:Myosin motor domain-containing protein n=1 Tax=Heligmosomoides polygyrus TaxID=6339 RepID=A0A8L8K2M3_HELPZ
LRVKRAPLVSSRRAFLHFWISCKSFQKAHLQKRVPRAECEPTTMNSLAADLCQLTEPNAATVLDSLTRRYQQNVIHTYCGLFCVVLNPWRTLPIYTTDVMSTYRTGVGDTHPHVYMVAQSAYDGILRGGRNQSILITGESGAGKTENTKKIIEYVLECCGQNNSVGGDVISTGVLLEAFGNARTTHNSNSSRFGKFIRIDFNEQGKLQSAQIECYLLEKSRVVNQDVGNRNFHVFYQLLSKAFSDDMRKQLLLTQPADRYKFLNQGNASVDKDIDDVANAMDRLGITAEEKIGVYGILAACLLIGEIRFGERSGLDMSYVDGQAEIDAVTTLLGVRSNRLVEALTQPSIRVGDKVIRKNQNMQKSVFSAAALAKVLYERVFKWLLEKCNEAISANTSMLMSRFIGVLDIAGFEIVQKNSFEQLCINYTNEKLQAFFNHFMFVREQSEYIEEGIQWTQSDFALDLQPTIDIIEKPLGLLSLLEEECVVPNGSDQSLLNKLCTSLEKFPQFRKAKQSQRCQSVRHFTIKHYAGSVDYNIDSWVEKNRDVIENAVLEVMGESVKPLVKSLFPPGECYLSGPIRLALASCLCRNPNQLSSLLDTLSSSSAHFIRCVVPNYERLPNKIDGPLVLNQLKCNGVLEGIRICREGYPSRLPFADFVQRYRLFAKEAPHYGAEEICRTVGIDHSRYQIGKTKIFCKIGVISEVCQEFTRYELSCALAHDSIEAICTIQDNVRTFAGVAGWPWYRIFSLVRPLIPKERDKERIKELEELNAELREENEKLRHENMKLSAQLMPENKNKMKIRNELFSLKEDPTLEEKNREIQKVRIEMQQNEDVFDLLEKKYNDQHQKVMKMNEALREYERKLDQIDMEKKEFEREVKKRTLRETKERECEKIELITAELRGRLERLMDEANQSKEKLKDLDISRVYYSKLKKTFNQHLNLQKEECRRKDQEINRLEKKLEDKEVVMADCARDLKEQHKTRVHELEERVAEMKRKLMKYECLFTISSTGRSSSGRMSNSGRQGSLMSFSSFSSVRTLNRRMTDSELRDSQYDLSNCGLQRAPSTSNVMEKDRKISDLERQLNQAHTEQQLMKREMEVYKASLGSLEQEKDSLVRQSHNAAATSEELRRQLAAAESAADGLAERLRRAQADAECWKRKHEEAVQEAKNDILYERKRTAEKLAAFQHENNIRNARRGENDVEREHLRDELARTQVELDRALATIRQLEGNMQSQEALGGTLEAQYRNALMELETARDENCALKAKIRRQYKQIELLTQQDETNSALNTFENKLGRMDQKEH